MACLLAAPAKSHAATATWDSFSNPTVKLWTAVVDWVRGLWAVPGASTRLPRLPSDGKFGAGHSSDGRAREKGAF